MREPGSQGQEPGKGFAGRESRRVLTAEQATRALVEQAEDWFERLRTAAARALTSVSLDEILKEALLAVAESLDADEAAVLIASDDESELTARMSVGLGEEVDLAVHMPAGHGFAGRILETRRPFIVDDLESFEVFSPALRTSKLKSIVGVPLMAGSSIVGVMHAGSKSGRRFGEEDIAALERLAFPVAAAVERVRLFNIERQLREVAELTAARLSALQRITSSLAAAQSVTEVCETIVEHAIAGDPHRRGEVGVWMLREGRLMRVVGGERSRGFDEIPLDQSLPATEHLTRTEPFFVESRAALLERWPVLATTDTNAFAGFPLIVGERWLGVMAVAYTEDHAFDENERAYLSAVADQASLAIDRAVSIEAETAAQERRAFLADTSIALTSRYASPDQLLETLARLAVPRLADWCSVVLDHGGRFEEVAFAHDLAHLPPGASELAIRLAEEAEARFARTVFGTGTPLVLGGAGDRPIDPAQYGPFAEAVGLTSAIFVPFENHGRPAGVMVFLACGAHARYSIEDVAVAEELTSRASRLVEDLVQRARERSLAETLTRALLPARLPDLPGLELVARYLPAEAGPVGGDWYDAFELPDRRVALVVGDVGGHGVEAASAMGRLRNGLFAFASEGHDPPTALQRLSDLLANDSRDWNMPDPIASVSFAVLNRSTLTLHSTCAGHPPWVLLRDGVARMRECGGRVLAGSLPAAPRDSDHQLEVGDVCIFMTDGLIERSDEDMELSLKRLTKAAEESAALPLERLADALLAATAPPVGRADDCCILLARITARSEPLQNSA